MTTERAGTGPGDRIFAAAALLVALACSSGGSSGGPSSPACTPECTGGQTCVDGKCTATSCGAQGQPCCEANACNSGLVCGGTGTCTTGVSSCGKITETCCANDTCESGLACLGGTCKTSGQMGAPCTKNGDCPSGLCVPSGKANVCTIACSSTAECVPGWTCKVTGTAKVCGCEPSYEVCDELDNDCDGTVDDKPDGECVYVVAGEPASGIAVDATGLYFTSQNAPGGGTGNKGVKKVPVAGGTPTLLAPTPEPLYDNPKAIVIDAANVYWTSDEGAGYVMKVPKAGGSATTLAAKENKPRGLAVDTTTVYWTNAFIFSGCCDAGTVKSVPIAGGTVTTLMPQKNYMAPHGIAVDATSLYFADTNIGELWKMPLAGGTPVSLGKPGTVGPSIAMDATGVYFSGKAGIQKLPLEPVDGGAPTTIAAVSYANSLAIDGTSIYWTSYDASAPTTGTVMKAPLTGGTPVTLATGQGWPNCVAVDATHVYWTETSAAGPGRILRRVK